MSTSAKPRKSLSVVQALLAVLVAIAAAGVGYFEFFCVKPPYVGLVSVDVLSDRTLALAAVLTALLRAVPLLLLGATFCAAYFIYQPRGLERRRAGWTTLALLVCAAGLAAVHQPLADRVFLPAVDRERHELAQLFGTRTTVREPAPNVTVTTGEKETIQLADLHGSLLVLNFFAIDSPPCILELQELQSLWKEFRMNTGLWMLAVGRSESMESVEAFGRDHGFTLPLAADPDGTAFDQFATEGVPRLYLISRDGRVLFQCQGYHEQDMTAFKVRLEEELARPRKPPS